MAASDFLSQVDPTRYQPVAPGNANSVENSQQITPSNTNNRSEYLKQLNGTLSQKKKPVEKTPSKTKPENKPQQQQQSPPPSKANRPATPKTKTEPASISSANEAATKPEGRSVNNIEQQDVSQTDQPKIKNQNAFVAEGNKVSEVLVPPASIEELFQIDELPEEVAEAIAIETNNVDATTPPFGLVIALNQVETDHHGITTNQTENSGDILADDPTVLSVDQTVVATNLITTQNESNNKEADIPAAQTPESVPSTQQITDKTIAPSTLIEQLTNNTNEKNIKPITPATETITENTGDEPLILPFPNNENKKEDSIVSESSTDDSIEQAETSPSAKTPVAKQRITQIANEQPPIDFVLENKAPAAQASQQEATATTTISKKISVTNQSAKIQEAPELALPSTSFSEVFAEIDAAKNKEETANKSRAESILDQTVTAMETSIEQGQSLKIRLTPPELGTIHIQLTTNDAGAITARLDVQTPEAQAALMQHLQNLQETLQQNGTPVEQITIQMTSQTAEDQASDNSDQSKEQSAQQEENEEDQQQNQKQQEQEEQPNESDDSDQLNIAA